MTAKNLGVCVFVILLGAGVWFWFDSNSPVPARQSVEAVVSNPAKAISTTDQGLKADTASGFPAPAETVARKLTLDNAQDLAIFVEKAESNPKGGSFFLALRALDTCQTIHALNVASMRSDASSDDPRIVRAREVLANRCGKLPAQNRQEEFEKLLAKGAAQGDAVLAATGAVVPMSRMKVVDREAFVSLITEGDDPYIVAQALSFIPVTLELREKLSISGRTYGSMSAQEQSNFQAALKLVPCDLGRDCGQDNLEVIAACANGACSVSNYEELVKAQYSHGGKGFDWNQVQSFRSTLTQKIRSKDRQAFAWLS
jgi:hypothetical protein